ncbi:hypothetical protein M2651_04575 [Clostridium sp. SYSU_GA19001]|uniref:hypothetical protein n=1 Tax=Clostridium caldaquaticum TaxID=2940653 RepID=UPI00207734C3|nr:hypothetical protein [Clostridium caldaquaticum]MCM8710300.1 hypothetical protein [Clostridium caldaquaticum]
MMKLIAASQIEFNNTIDDILQRPEYRHLKNILRDLIERIKESLKNWFIDFLKRTFSNMKNVTSLADRLSTIFMIIGILVIAGIIILIALKINRSLEKKSRIKEILGEKIDSRTTPDSLREKAAEFIKSEDYRQGVRYEFIALLLLMHEKNIVYLDETKTNEEIYSYLKTRKFPNLKSFKYLVDIFNSSWYGQKSVESTDYSNWNRIVSLLWNEVMNYEEKA